jgi:3'-5' exoribonuclease
MEIEVKKINEFNINERVEGYFMIKSSECRTSTNSKQYMDIDLGDKTGEINAKYWNMNEGDDKIYIPNTIVKIRGLVTSWQNNIQFKIEKIRVVDENDDIEIADYVPSAPYKPEEMLSVVMEFLEKIQSEDIKNIVEYIVDENKVKLMHFPAAKKNHHAIRGGLLYHTTTMLKAAEKLSEVYTFLNTDLLYAGVILHDISKIEEMLSSEFGVVSEYTIEGQLLGHIIQGIKNIEVVANGLGIDKEVTMLLQHMVLSHHYEAEYGSPKKPMIPEAQVLHYLDTLDASMYDMKKALNDTKEGEFSDSIFSLERRRIYKPLLSNKREL